MAHISGEGHDDLRLGEEISLDLVREGQRKVLDAEGLHEVVVSPSQDYFRRTSFRYRSECT